MQYPTPSINWVFSGTPPKAIISTQVFIHKFHRFTQIRKNREDYCRYCWGCCHFSFFALSFSFSHLQKICVNLWTKKMCRYDCFGGGDRKNSIPKFNVIKALPSTPYFIESNDILCDGNISSTQRLLPIQEADATDASWRSHKNRDNANAVTDTANIGAK